MPDFDLSLRNQLTERQQRRKGNIERVFSRKQIEQAFIESFELVGGVPRLALWANDEENYGQFLKLLMQLAPKDSGAKVLGEVLEYRSNIPQSPLNNPSQGGEIEDGEIVE